MRQYWLAVAAATLVSACSGGNPFLEDGEGVDPPVGIPADLVGELDSFTYNPAAQTLVVRGIPLENSPYEVAYDRAPLLDVPGYEAYSTQESSLGRHSTAYVQQRDGATATIVVTGGQFGYYFSGTQYARSGAYDPPTAAQNNGSITYAGTYVGLLNAPGDDGDLLGVATGTDIDIRSSQAAEVTGDVVINADFIDGRVNGLVYNRRIVDSAGTDLSGQNLELAPTEILADGTFVGDTTQEQNDRGTYGGIFAGTDASAVAGTLYAEDHITQINDIEEHGLFVLSQCGTPNADPVCNQPHQ